MPVFELGCAIPVKSHVLEFGLDWFNWRYGMLSLRGVTSDLQCLFLNLAEAF